MNFPIVERISDIFKPDFKVYSSLPTNLSTNMGENNLDVEL